MAPFEQPVTVVTGGETWRDRWLGADVLAHEPQLPAEAADAEAIQVGCRIWAVAGKTGQLRLTSIWGGIHGGARHVWLPGTPIVARRAFVNNHLRGVNAADLAGFPDGRGQFPSAKDQLAVIGLVALWGDLRPDGLELAGDYGYPVSIDEIIDRRPGTASDPWTPIRSGDPKQNFAVICRPSGDAQNAIVAELRATYGLSSTLSSLAD